MVRFGVIGTNWITDQLLESVGGIPDFVLSAVYSRTEQRAVEFAKKYGVHTIFTNLEEMAESDEIDAVYIASPNSFHAQQGILFLNNGKHVLCEKPLASNTAELELMFQAARKNQVVLMEALKTTLLPNFQSIQDNLHKIGKVRRYFASFCKYSSRYDAYRQGTVLNAFNPAFSNGSLMDLGVYCIYPMVVLFGEPDRLKAESLMLESGVDGEGSLLLHYGSMDAVIMHSKITNSYLPAEIHGEDGTIIIDQISVPEKVEIRYKNGEREIISRTQDHPAMHYQVQEFIDLIKTGKTESQINSYHRSRITAQIVEEARKQTGIIYPADKR
ncbi:Gfo/Idh/MocA family protein [Bacillus sp. T33-2]|uniref:Gfo/Idh/MocA family protein n=1 Tax=Bacillus sp. T33-2 TaxID=2054168 RepID=UPI000C78B05B|nr:Gfo/Idh/MocA family oxidoreductase [Bacillus sp. T33-2]PLR96634.1 oxidoreductase [Bacillus sp. T33-2]